MPLPHADPGPFLSSLDWLHRLGEIPWDVAAGDLPEAGRNAVDVAGDVPDAVIPGQVLPHLADDHPRHHASEVLGIDRNEHPGLARGIDATLETLSNPLTYLSLGKGSSGKLAAHFGVPFIKSMQHEIGGSAEAIEGAGKLLHKGAEALPEAVKKPAKAAATTVRRAMNWLDIPDEGKQLIDETTAKGQNTARAGTAEVERIYKDLSPAEQEAIGELAHGIARNGTKDRTAWQEITDPNAYLSGRKDIDVGKVVGAMQGRDRLAHVQRVEGIRDQAFSRGIRHNDDTYLARKFSGVRDTAAEPDVFGVPSPIKAREEELKTPGGLLKFLQHPDQAKVDLEFNALKADLHRAESQGRLAERAHLGNALTAGQQLPGGGDFSLANPQHVAQVRQHLAAMAKTQPDFAYRLGNIFNGIPSRENSPMGWFTQGLAGANGLFKKAATVGVVLPRLGFNVRNRVSALWQAISDDETRGTVGQSAKRVLSDLLGAVDDGYAHLTGSRLTGNEMTRNIGAIEQAFRTSGGSRTKAMEMVRAMPGGQLMHDALKHGVMDNFISSEQLLAKMAATPAKRRLNSLLDWPAEIGKGVEQRLRLGTFGDLVKGGMASAQAAKATKSAYLDYGVSGLANRVLRDVVPFGVFLSQNLKQQAGFLAKHPAVAVAAANVLGSSGDDKDIKYPWLEQQAAIPTGLDNDGNPQYFTGLGLPIEQLTQVPGTDVGGAYHDVVGNLNPVLKSAIAYGVNKDPQTGQNFGAYDRNPLTGEHGTTGRIYQELAATGLVQPFTNPIQQYSIATDPRTNFLEKALQLGTGAHFVSVDPTIAQREQLEQYVQDQPEIHQSVNYYQTGNDPGLDEVLHELQIAKTKLHQQRQLAKASLDRPTQ